MGRGGLDLRDLAEISLVALAVCSARVFTSAATTAKPLPAAPARAASMVALRASRFVWPAMVEISPTTSPMRETAVFSSSTRAPVRSASPTARRASSAEPLTCRPISCTDEPSSSAAAATVLTFEPACSAAAATVVDWLAVSVAVAVMVWAVACSSVAEEDTMPMMPPTAASNPSAIWRIPALRCSSAARRARAVSSSRARVRIRLSLNTCTAEAIAPISLRSPAWGISTVASPSARRSIRTAMRRIGREIVTTDIQATASVIAAATATTMAMATCARRPEFGGVLRAPLAEGFVEVEVGLQRRPRRVERRQHRVEQVIPGAARVAAVEDLQELLRHAGIGRHRRLHRRPERILAGAHQGGVILQILVDLGEARLQPRQGLGTALLAGDQIGQLPAAEGFEIRRRLAEHAGRGQRVGAEIVRRGAQRLKPQVAEPAEAGDEKQQHQERTDQAGADGYVGEHGNDPATTDEIRSFVLSND